MTSPPPDLPLYTEAHADYGRAFWLAPLNRKRYGAAARIGRFPRALWPIVQEILVSADHRIALVKNSKAGCTTAAHMIHFYDRGTICEVDVHRPDIGLIQGPEHFETAVRVLRRRRTFRLTTVRHPVRRAVSAFQDFFVDRRNHLAVHHAEAIRYFGFDESKSDEANFDAFLDYVTYSLKREPIYTDRHFRPQVINTAWGHLRYGAVARVENLHNDLQAAMQRAGIDMARLKGFDFSPRNATPRESYRPNAWQIQRLAQIYAPDFAAFGYRPDSL